jgi:hypothetical protein
VAGSTRRESARTVARTLALLAVVAVALPARGEGAEAAFGVGYAVGKGSSYRDASAAVLSGRGAYAGSFWAAGVHGLLYA